MRRTSIVVWGNDVPNRLAAPDLPPRASRVAVGRRERHGCLSGLSGAADAVQDCVEGGGEAAVVFDGGRRHSHMAVNEARDRAGVGEAAGGLDLAGRPAVLGHQPEDVEGAEGLEDRRGGLPAGGGEAALECAGRSAAPTC